MNKSGLSFPRSSPGSILMLKAHSIGVGDLLRSSAAWRVLRNRFPRAQLHLWMLTRELGAASEDLIRHHHLLAGFRVSDKHTRGLSGWKRLLGEGRQLVEQTRPGLIIDFEPGGIRTSLLAMWARVLSHAPTVGIAQEPLRRCFYTRPAPSTRAYARQHGLTLPMDYTERDFVALSALGLERQGTPIELRETEAARLFREQLCAKLGQGGVVGLNIGCGTPDAVPKRPPLDLLADLLGELQGRHNFSLVLTGAPFEREINQQFLAHFQPRGPVIDTAGRTSLLDVSGVISACRLFISSDSGPYHMAVALRVPTLALFVVPNAQHYHHNAWTRCLVAPSRQSLPDALEAAEELLRVTPTPLPEIGT
jgi:ADP-heptose:LPS heptosyltransferase